MPTGPTWAVFARVGAAAMALPVAAGRAVWHPSYGLRSAPKAPTSARAS